MSAIWPGKKEQENWEHPSHPAQFKSVCHNCIYKMKAQGEKRPFHQGPGSWGLYLCSEISSGARYQAAWEPSGVLVMFNWGYFPRYAFTVSRDTIC